jgi:hypothetical protein
LRKILQIIQLLGGFFIKILLFGDEKYCDFYTPFLTKNGFEVIKYDEKNGTDIKGVEFSLLFPKDDIHTTQDLIKEIKEKWFGKIKIMPVIEKMSYSILEDMFFLEVPRICFEFKPEIVLEEFKRFIDTYSKKEVNGKNSIYIINFYENIGTFFIDISGEIKKEKLIPLKLMFSNYLSNKLKKLKGIVYLFNNTDEDSLNFLNIWALMRIWKEIGFPYEKIFFLTTSETIKRRMYKYTGHLGINYATSLLDIVKDFYPEIAKKDEMEIFEFASSLLQCEGKTCV